MSPVIGHWRASETVRRSSEVMKIRGNLTRLTAASPGTESGTISSMEARKRVAPSPIACSLRSRGTRGTPRTTLVGIQIATGSENVMETKTSPWSELPGSGRATMIASGMNSSEVGIG